MRECQEIRRSQCLSSCCDRSFGSCNHSTSNVKDQPMEHGHPMISLRAFALILGSSRENIELLGMSRVSQSIFGR
jgi:hypothetical protein